MSLAGKADPAVVEGEEAVLLRQRYELDGPSKMSGTSVDDLSLSSARREAGVTFLSSDYYLRRVLPVQSSTLLVRCL